MSVHLNLIEDQTEPEFWSGPNSTDYARFIGIKEDYARQFRLREVRDQDI
jgi:hypothetical protein